MKWIRTQVPDGLEVQKLCEDLANKTPFPKALANILVQRGITNLKLAQEFFRPKLETLHDPFLMKDMDKAVMRIQLALDRGEKIMIYGDYDVDGTTSVALLSMFFNEGGVAVECYVPDREKEGYGISFAGIDKAVKWQTDLIIALDCGTKAIDKIAYAKSKGIDVIVCDHHTPGSELPDAVALLNPKQRECEYPDKNLSACGVGLKLCYALTEEVAQFKEVQVLDRFGDLLALSIACDIVPIMGENRVLAAFGLDKMRRDPLPGLRALMDMSESERRWDVGDLLFFIGPRINAAGRLSHAIKAVELLRGESNELDTLARHLESANTERKTFEQMITDSALQMIDERQEEVPDLKATVLFNEEWKKGVIGIVASRLQETHYRPTILLTRSNGHWVGSGRSVSEFDLYNALEVCREHLMQFGGHRHAVGLTIDGQKLEQFREAFEAFAGKELTGENLIQRQEINYSLGFEEVDDKFIRLLQMMEPFGPGNLEPVFETKGVNVLDYRVLKDVHIRMQLEKNGIQFNAIGFKMAEKWEKTEADIIDIAYQPSINRWNGNEYIQLKLKDFKSSDIS